MDYKKIRKRIMIIGVIGIIVLTSFLLINNQIQVYALSDNLDESSETLKKYTMKTMIYLNKTI